MKFSLLFLHLLFYACFFGQDKPRGIFLPGVIDINCDEIVDYDMVKNNRLISFDQRESGVTARFIFQSTCCAKHQFTARYSGDSLFLNAHQINNVSCDCSCYFKTTLSFPFLDPKLVFWENGEYLGIDKTEYIEYPVSFEIFEGDTINFVDQFKRNQGKFIIGEDKHNPKAIGTFENDSLISGWSILDYHENNTPRILKTFKKHNVGDKAIYTYFDSNQNILSECYRFYPNYVDYFEFCSTPSEGEFVLPDSSAIEYLTFVSDSVVLRNREVSFVDYNTAFQKALSNQKTSYIILLENAHYSEDFLSKLEALKSNQFLVFRKELKNE